MLIQVRRTSQANSAKDEVILPKLASERMKRTGHRQNATPDDGGGFIHCSGAGAWRFL